jgi:hypothetical protein
MTLMLFLLFKAAQQKRLLYPWFVQRLAAPATLRALEMIRA